MDMPWWTVRGREPDRMERWAAYLLPPLQMGDNYVAVGGDATARLHAIDSEVYEVISSVVTRYRRTRAARERALRHFRLSQVSYRFWYL